MKITCLPRARALLVAAFSFGSLLPIHGAVETYDIDPIHTSVGFTVRHFFTKVPGVFTNVKGSIVVDREHLEKSTVEAVVNVASFNTNFAMRDDDVRDNFFEVAKFPLVTFKSKSWKKTGDTTYDVTGDLRIKSVTKEVVLKVKALGFGPGMNGASISGWEASTTLDRRDYDVSKDQDSVAALVEIIINVEADLKQPATAKP